MTSKVISMKCKVCADANKPMAVITSHFTKNKSGVVICPTLLEQECRYCKNKGHTIKYCKTLEKNNAVKLAAEKPKRIARGLDPEPVAPGLTVLDKSNAYSVLCVSDNEDGEEREQETKIETPEEFPMLCEPKIQTQQSLALSYSTVLVSEPKPKPVQKRHFETTDKPVINRFENYVKPAGKWADAESSDEEDDEDEEDEVPPKPVDNVTSTSVYFQLKTRIENRQAEKLKAALAQPVVVEDNSAW